MPPDGEITRTFELVRFSPRRAGRGAPAAEVQITDDDNQVRLWMSRRNLLDNIAEWGPHQGLVDALNAYGGHYLIPPR